MTWGAFESFGVQVPWGTIPTERCRGPQLAVAATAPAPAMSEALHSLVGGIGIAAPADLRDKAIAASGPTSGNTAVLKKMLTALGLAPTEYQVLNVGGTPDRYAALHSGQVGAALLTQPFDIQAAAETGASAEVAAQLYDLYLREVKIYRPDAEPLLSHLQGNIDLLLEVQAIEPPAPSPEQFLDLGP